MEVLPRPNHAQLPMPLVILAPMVITAFVDQVFHKRRQLECSYANWTLPRLKCSARADAVRLRPYFRQRVGRRFGEFPYNAVQKLQTLTPSFYSTTRTGDIMMRLTGDLETMRHFVSWGYDERNLCSNYFYCGTRCVLFDERGARLYSACGFTVYGVPCFKDA